MHFFQALLIWTLSVVLARCKLYQTFVFFRHGARYHTNDIFDGNSTYPMRS